MSKARADPPRVAKRGAIQPEMRDRASFARRGEHARVIASSRGTPRARDSTKLAAALVFDALVVRNRFSLLALASFAVVVASACASKSSPPAGPSSDGGPPAVDAGNDGTTPPSTDASVGEDAGDASEAPDVGDPVDSGDAGADVAIIDYPRPNPVCSYVDPSRAVDSEAGVDASDDAADGDTTDAAGPTGTRIRVMTANTTSTNLSVYDTPGIHLFQSVKPDIVMVQELKYPAGLRALVDTAFGTDFSFMVETQSGGIPNGIVSRYPILESGEWEDPDVPDRDFAYARIDIPGPIDLWAVSIHLKTSDATTRHNEARLLVSLIKAAVPAGAYLVIGGDLNATTPQEPALADLAEITDVTSTKPVDQLGSEMTNANRTHRYDWLMPSPNLEARRMPLRLGASVYCNGLVMDSRVYSPIEEAAPLQRADSNAINMQHMPVVRDFFVSDL